MRRVSRRILILCEGHTEERYAKQMKHDLLPRELQRSVSVEVSKGQQQDPLSLVWEDEPLYERNPFVTIPELLAFFESLKNG